MKKIVDNIYDKYITFENVYKIWNIVKKTCKNKKAVYLFSKNKVTNIENIVKCLKNRTYKPMPFRLFLIFEPKERLVMSQCITDKIVNHFVANYYLLPYLENKLIDSNVATRKNKGSSYAGYLIEKYINTIRLKEPNKNIYALKIDISKYFYNINHDILINMLENDIKDKDVINIIKIIIGETNKPYINETISYLNKAHSTEIPLYKYNTGLSIGAMTSQFLAIYYLNKIDHYIKEKLKCNYYIRYMDDFLLFCTDKDELLRLYYKISKKIIDLKLMVNTKSGVFNMKNGISFVGYKYLIDDKRFIIKYCNKTIKKINKKLNYLYKNDLIKYYRSYASYYGYLVKIKDVERNFKMSVVDKYNYYKNIYKTYIVFVVEKGLYICYDNSFSISKKSLSNIFDILNKNAISYVIVDYYINCVECN